MTFSTTELSYLRDSLGATPSLRPDCRQEGQSRPVHSEVDVLPFTYGSARVTSADGGECFAAIKAKVVPRHKNLINVSVHITGQKDVEILMASLAHTVQQILNDCPELISKLILTEKYAFELSVDCVVLFYSTYPLSLLSVAVFQALRSARLPLLISSKEDIIVDETPQFHDDWEAATYICDDWDPPLLFIVAIIADGVFLDPTQAEIQVSEAVLGITWKNSSVATPIKSIDIGIEPYTGSVAPKTLLDAYDLVKSHAPDFMESLLAD